MIGRSFRTSRGISVMDERAVSVSESDLGSYPLVIPGHDDLWSWKSERWFPVCFGISYAFFVLRLLSSRGLSTVEDEGGFREVCDKVLCGSAQLLGMLAWKSQKLGFDGEKRVIGRKLEVVEMELEELRRVRQEDAKANEKVVGIFAAQEQRWFNERRKLQQHIGSLVHEVKVLVKKKDEVVSELSGKIKELGGSVQSMEKSLEEERVSVNDLKEKLRKAEAVAEDLRERAKREAQDHLSKIRKHKTAFIELVSNQRQTEAELDRAIRQVEASKREFEYVFAQEEESASVMQKLSSELVRMQTDVEQKDKILSAVLRKSRLDAAEKQMLMKQVKLLKSMKKQAEFDAGRFKPLPKTKDAGNSLRNVFANQVNVRLQGSFGARKDCSVRPGSSHARHSRSQSVDLPVYGNQDSTDEMDRYPVLYDGYPPQDCKRLDEWVRMEVEKYAKVIEQQHHLEVDAFVEQIGMKDEKLEEFRWRLLSMEIESKSLHSHVEALNEEISQLRLDNTKLEATLISREEELESKYPAEVEENEAEIAESPSTIPRLEFRAVQSPERESEEEDEFCRSITVLEARETPTDTDEVEKSPSASEVLSKSPPLKMDLQALGAFYKIKRLKQHLLMLERLVGKQESSSHNSDGTSERAHEVNNFLSLISVLNKQVGRYESLQERIDDLCKRVHEKNLDTTHSDSDNSRSKGRTKELEILLEETFQLQRYMVSTGQKMMEIRSKVSNGFIGVAEQVDDSVDIDMKRFSEGLRTLFRDVQGGLEVRMARIIGDLEGTLAYDGMINLR